MTLDTPTPDDVIRLLPDHRGHFRFDSYAPSVWYNAVGRGDFSPVVIRAGANVQDCEVIHVTPRGGVDIGAGATIGHLCLVHAATIGDEALVGNGSKVLDGATIGARSTGTEIPEGVLAIGARESEGPARRVRRRWSG